MQRFAFAIAISLVAIVAVAAGWSRSLAQDDRASLLVIQDPPTDWLETAVPVDTLEAVEGNPRAADAGAGADTCVDATGLTLSFFSPADGGATLTNPYTEQDSDPLLTCMWGTPSNPRGYRTVWYRYVATDTGQVTITTRGTNYDTVVAVYSGSCDALLQLACSDDFLSLQSEVSFQAVRNQTYFIEVADWQSAAPAPAVLAFSAVMDGRETRWAQVGNIPLGGISRHAVAQQGSQIYIIGGQQNLAALPVLSSQLQRFDASTGQWSPQPPDFLAVMPIAYSNTTAVQIGGNIYVPGGFSGNETAYDGRHWQYNIANDLWTQAPPIPTALLPGGQTFAWSAAVADPSDQSYYLVGGLRSQPPLDPDAAVVERHTALHPDHRPVAGTDADDDSPVCPYGGLGQRTESRSVCGWRPDHRYGWRRYRSDDLADECRVLQPERQRWLGAHRADELSRATMPAVPLGRTVTGMCLAAWMFPGRCRRQKSTIR